MTTSRPDLSCVLLTQGDRPDELDRAVTSVRRQHGAPVEVVVVANGPGIDVSALPGDVVVDLGENAGVPGGRNVGMARSSGGVVLFLDDDAWLPDRGTAERVRRDFDEDPRLGVVSLRILDPETGRTERRHVPRLRAGDPERSSDVTTFLGGACAIRRTVFERCGPFPARFGYGHEETDFAWRALDVGVRIRYDAGAMVYHPNGPASARHPEFHRLTARNRVWLARRRLPAPLVPLYLATWAALTMARERDATSLRHWLAGFLEGTRTDPGTRRPISWATVVLMTRLGRPPIV